MAEPVVNVEYLDKFEKSLPYGFEKFPAMFPFTIHQSSAWYGAYVSSCQTPILCLNVIKEIDGQILGILPLQIQPYRGTRFWDMRLLLPLAHGPSDFVNLLVEPGHEEEFADAIAGWLRRHSNAWERLFLPYIPASSQAWQPLVGALRAQGFEPQVDLSHTFFEVDATQDWDSYFHSYIKTRNADLLKDIRKLERMNAYPRVMVVKEGIEKYLPVLLPIYARRRSALGQANKYEEERSREFLARVLRAYEDSGSVELSMLVGTNDDVWAYQLDWLDRGVRYHYMHAYNDHYKQYSPGKLLLYEILKRSFASPETLRCNFMRGEAEYKNRFANVSQGYVYIRVENPRSLRQRATRMAGRLVNFKDGLVQTVRGAG